MKIVQSFWSKPFQQPHDTSFESRMMGGFPLKRYFIYTWVLSLLQLKRHFKQVHLITDDWGKRFFIDILKLPYDSYAIDLNAIQHVSSKYWCAGKLFVFSTLNEPFLHFDGDLILGNNFYNYFSNGSLIAEFQFNDVNNDYRPTLEHLTNKYALFILPQHLLQHIFSTNFDYQDFNMGIFGGEHYKFINDYATASLNIINENNSFIPTENISISFLNCFIEQYCFFKTCYQNTKSVSLFIKEPLIAHNEYQKCFLNSSSMNFNFIHLHNHYKLNYYKKTEEWLKIYYPSEYLRINNILFT